MQFVFNFVNWLGPAALVFEAIVATGVAVVLLLGFILLRRARRHRYFRRRDRRTLEIRRGDRWPDRCYLSHCAAAHIAPCWSS